MNKVYFPWYVCYSGVIGLQCAYDKELPCTITCHHLMDQISAVYVEDKATCNSWLLLPENQSSEGLGSRTWLNVLKIFKNMRCVPIYLSILIYTCISESIYICTVNSYYNVLRWYWALHWSSDSTVTLVNKSHEVSNLM